MSLRLLRQHPDRDIAPSTRPRTHRYIARRLFGRSRWGSPSLSEEVHGDHRSCIAALDTGFGPVVKDRTYLVPDKRDCQYWFHRVYRSAMNRRQRASFMASIKVCASALERQQIVASTSLHARTSSMRDGSPCGSNLRLIKRSKAEVLNN